MEKIAPTRPPRAAVPAFRIAHNRGEINRLSTPDAVYWKAPQHPRGRPVPLAPVANRALPKQSTMYAIVEIAGKQFKAEPDATLFVPFHADANQGDTVTFDRVLLVGGDAPSVGTPVVEGASVEAEVLGHVRGDKVIVFKKKRRKRYRRTRGHRQNYTQIRITTVNA